VFEGAARACEPERAVAARRPVARSRRASRSRHRDEHPRRDWWAPPPDDLSHALAFRGMPPTLFGFALRTSAWSQVWISLLAIGVFVLNTVPLELQRRILNATVVNGEIKLIFGLVVVYACVVLSEGLVKLLMNVYRGWVGEKAVRALRLATSALVDSMPEQRERRASRASRSR